MNTRNLNSIWKEFDQMLGGTELFTRAFALNDGYPYFNIIELDSKKTVMEFAVSGFKEDELSVHKDGNKLIVKGSSKSDKDTNNYLYRGISRRDFERSFNVSQHVEIEGADLMDGILSVYLVKNIPEEKKPVSIPINRVSERQYLTETRDDIVSS